MSLENNKKEEKKIYLNKNERESIGAQKLIKVQEKIGYRFMTQIDNVYVLPNTRIKLKERFFFDEKFWNALISVRNEKIKGKNLENFLKILDKTLCQKLVVWDKFIECFRLNMEEMTDKNVFYKPCRVEELFIIIERLSEALNNCKGINMREFLLSDIFEKNQKFLTGLITDFKDFTHFSILSVYKQFCPNLDNSNMEKASRIKLELNGDYLEFSQINTILAIYNSYFKDSDHKEFGILGKIFKFI